MTEPLGTLVVTGGGRGIDAVAGSVRVRRAGLFFLFAFALFLLVPLHSQQTANSLLIVNAEIADGTGGPLRKANVRVAGGHIEQIGALAPEKNEAVIDATGLVLAPGFIDIHNHSAERILSDPLAETQIAQGITSLVVGADGDSPWPIITWVRSIETLHPAPNVAVFAGHATIRELVLEAARQ